MGDEEFEIPPITPPPETESGLGLSEVDSPFPAMPEPPAPHRGPLIPQFPPQSLDLPSITISRNMMDQEGVSVNNGQSVVSTAISQLSEEKKPLSCSHLSRIRNLAPVLLQQVSYSPDLFFDDVSKLKDFYKKALLLNHTVMSPSEFCMPPIVGASGTASGLVYNTGGI